MDTKKAAIILYWLFKSAPMGHPFYGNQYVRFKNGTFGVGGAPRTLSEAAIYRNPPKIQTGDTNTKYREGAQDVPVVGDGKIRPVIVQQLDMINPDHLDGLHRVWLEEGDNVDGAFGDYSPARSAIRIAAHPSNMTVDGRNTLAHEVGHHVHLRKLTDEGAQEWANISKNGKNARISSYATTNQGEHFADAYRAYVKGGTDRENLKSLEPNAYKFIEDVVKSNRYVLPRGKMADVTNWQVKYGSAERGR